MTQHVRAVPVLPVVVPSYSQSPVPLLRRHSISSASALSSSSLLSSMRIVVFFFIIILLFHTYSCNARDIPTKKAIPPLMDPIPILPEITHRIYMDITIGSGGDGEGNDDTTSSVPSTTGRIIIGLFGTNAPTAAENFRLLSTCPTTTSTSSTCYKGTIFHRIIPNFAIQGGDTTHGNGIGGRAAIHDSSSLSSSSSSSNNNNNKKNTNIGTYQPYMINATTFNRPYMVAVATPNTQRAKSQFFITTVKTQWLFPLQYTIFGMILEGRDYLHTIEQHAGTYGGHPKVTVRIIDCGELPLQPYDLEPHY